MYQAYSLRTLQQALLEEMILCARDLSQDLSRLEKAGYKPEQPRALRGQPNGGQWVDGGGGSSTSRPSKLPLPNDPPIEPVYPELAIIPIFRIGRLATAWREWLAIRKISKEWQLSPTKSKIKWRNRLEKGNWTPQKITNTIRYGNRFRVKNERTGEPATRYEYKNSFVIRDNTTGDVLQLSGPDFIPKNFPR